MNAPAIGTEVVLASFPTGADWWDPDGAGLCIWAAYQPKGAANLAASYVDLSGNGNNCGPGAAPGWDAVNGWRFNGVNQWLDTLFVPQNDQSQTMIVQFTNYVTSGAQDVLSGMDQGGGVQFKLDIWVWNPRVRYNNGGFVQVVRNVAAGGNLCVAGNQGYWNGAPDGVAIGPWAGPTALTAYIGASNVWGAPAMHSQIDIQAYALYDCTLTALQVAAVAAAMAAL